MFFPQFQQGQSGVRSPARNHLVKNQAQTVNIRTAINLRVAIARQLAPLLRRHVVRSAQHLSGHGQGCALPDLSTGDFPQFCNAEIQQLDVWLAIRGGLANHDVFGLQIAMDDTHSMRRVQHAHDWIENGYGLAWSEVSACLQFNVESMSLDIFHDHVDHAVGSSAKIVYRDSVGMSKAPGSLPLTSKASQPFGVVPHLRRQDFYGYTVAKQDVAGAKDGAHAAFAQHRLNLVLAVEDCADN